MKMDFKTYSSASAIGAGLSAFGYAVSFVILRDPFWSGFFLMLSGLLALPVFVALFFKLKEVDAPFATVALILGILGAAGSLVHGGYDLANVINPPITVEDLPFAVNPRGLLSFGVTGLAVLKFAWLMQRSKQFPQGLSTLGLASGLMLLVIYVGRLIILNPADPVLRWPILIEGFIVNPIWYLWLGSILWGERS